MSAPAERQWTVATAGHEAAAPLAALHALCFAALPETPWSADSIRTVLRLPSTICLVGLDPDGEAAGFLAGRHTGGDAEVLTLCVAPAARRTGLARALIGAFVARIGAETRISLEVAVDNGPARALYESLGFRPAGRRPGYYGGGACRVDALVLVRGGKNNGGQPNEAG